MCVFVDVVAFLCILSSCVQVLRRNNDDDWVTNGGGSENDDNNNNNYRVAIVRVRDRMTEMLSVYVLGFSWRFFDGVASKLSADLIVVQPIECL